VGVGGRRYLDNLGNLGLTGTMPTELGLMTSLTWLYASSTLHPACRVERWWVLTSGVGGCRALWHNDLTGTMPTELGLMKSVTKMCASCRPPLRVGLNDGGF
jgi:hypothetical protein